MLYYSVFLIKIKNKNNTEDNMSQLKFISKQPINKGWSCDKKYCAITADGTKYFLRVTSKKI